VIHEHAAELLQLRLVAQQFGQDRIFGVFHDFAFQFLQAGFEAEQHLQITIHQGTAQAHRHCARAVAEQGGMVSGLVEQPVDTGRSAGVPGDQKPVADKQGQLDGGEVERVRSG
jgi:hypothetical protein